jgi:SPP1 family predicted phage head-tail adaptor
MDFSKLRHRITFLKPTGTYKNSMGENVPEYTEYKTVWAFVAPTTGREYEEAQKIREETTYKVITRYFPNITTDMKIKFNTQELDIVSVLNVNERNTELQIVAKEKDRNGYGKEC